MLLPSVKYSSFSSFSAGMKLIFNIWLENAASPMHFLHCGYGIGSLLIPLIANPFLAVPVLEAGTDYKNNTQFSPTNTIATTVTTVREEMELANNVTDYLEPSRIEIAYLIPSLVSIGVSFVFYLYHISKHIGTRQKETHPGSAHHIKSLRFKHMSLVLRKPVFGVSDQVPHKPACTVAEDG